MFLYTIDDKDNDNDNVEKDNYIDYNNNEGGNLKQNKVIQNFCDFSKLLNLSRSSYPKWSFLFVDSS